MNRVQNLIMVVWGLALLLFVAFNWSLANRIVDIDYLFMNFQVKVLLWLAFLGFAVPLGLRIITVVASRTIQRRTDKEISSIKSKAYDGLTGEFDRLSEKLEGRLSSQFDSFAAAQDSPAHNESDSVQEDGTKDAKPDKEAS